MPKLNENEEELELEEDDAADGAAEREEDDLPESEEEAEQDDDIEARARRQGWKPESEWDDDIARRNGIRKPTRFKSAEEFLRDAENNPSMQRERARAADKQIARLESKIDLMNKVFQDQRRLNAEAQQRAYEKGLADAKAKRREAIADGDVERVEQIDKEIGELEDQIDEVREVAGGDDGEAGDNGDARTPGRKPAARKASPNPEIDAWINKNPWFSTDPVRKTYMVDVHQRLVRENPGVPEADLLEDAKKEVRDKFPDRFGVNPARKGPPATRSYDRRGDGDGRSYGGKSWADVPMEDRAAYERTRQMIESTRKGEKYTREEFMKEYFSTPQRR